MKAFVSRKVFLRNAALLFASSAWLRFPPKKRISLSFSTLGCPEWSFSEITSFAARHGYQGIEFRGLREQMDITKASPFANEQAVTASLDELKRKGLCVVNLGSSASMHEPEPGKRQQNLDEARSYIRLAARLNCPFIRVFPNTLPAGSERQAALGRIVDGLRELSATALDHGVKILMETHGDLVKSDEIAAVMEALDPAQAGLVWDVANMWTITGEDPATVYKKLKPYIFHTHIKDAVTTGSQLTYTLPGKGNVPVFEAIRLLEAGGYRGYYSFEWEKRWHPELAGPATALAEYPLIMREMFDE